MVLLPNSGVLLLGEDWALTRKRTLVDLSKIGVRILEKFIEVKPYEFEALTYHS